MKNKNKKNKNESLLDDFLIDPNVQLAMDWEKSRNIFDILQLGETKHSKMLAWFLNPREGHLQGDFFLKSLLREIFKVKDETCVTNSFFKTWKILDLDIYNFNSAMVQTEVSINNNDKKAIDIVVLDPVNKVSIFIENKIGSKEREKQTENYFDGLSKMYDSYDQVFIFLDMYEGKAKDDVHWLNINYSWLMNAIKSLLRRDVLSKEIEIILEQYYENMEEEWERDRFYKTPHSLQAQIVKKHRKFLLELKKCCSQLVNLSSPDDLNENQWRYFYHRHAIFLDVLQEYTGFEDCVNSVSQKMGVEFEPEYKKNGFYIHATDWEKYYTENYTVWGVNFYIELDKNCDNPKGNRYNLRVKIFPDSFANEDQVRNLAKGMQAKLKSKGTKYFLIDQSKGVSESFLIEHIVSCLKKTVNPFLESINTNHV